MKKLPAIYFRSINRCHLAIFHLQVNDASNISGSTCKHKYEDDLMMKGLNEVKKNDWILPLLASIGVGAATFYTMSKNNGSIAKTVESMAPMLSNLTNGTSSNQNDQSGQLGPHGMS